MSLQWIRCPLLSCDHETCLGNVPQPFKLSDDSVDPSSHSRFVKLLTSAAQEAGHGELQSSGLAVRLRRSLGP